MGSRRGRHAALVSRALLGACAAAALGACTIGAPPGFSDGDQWVIPLIGPLENSLLLVPVVVDGKGPFVFAIDPDAPKTIIDEEVQQATKARTGEGPRMLDETDTQQTRLYVELTSLQLGTLTVSGQRNVQLVHKGTFDADGRRIHGVLGRDVIADSLVFGFDREMGVVTLQTQKAFKPPADAPSFGYSKLHSRIQNVETLPLPRRLVTVDINGKKFPVHLDLGAVASQLRSGLWPRAQLAEYDANDTVVDEVGMRRPVNKKGVASFVSVGVATAHSVAFVPYGDRRWSDQDLEGSLGLDFFNQYSVIVNWDTDKVYLKERGRQVQARARIARWQSKTLSGCAQPGCVKVTLIDPLAGKTPEQMPEKYPGLVASIVREPSARSVDLEVVIEASRDGKGTLKWLVANLPAGTDRAMTQLPIAYLGATLTVVDVSPFPRPCAGEGACIDLLRSPYDQEPAPPPQDQGPSTTEQAPTPAPPTQK